MHTRLSVAVLVLVMAAVAKAAPDEGLVAHWDFDQGKGKVLRDHSGHNHHGQIHGAKWMKAGGGYALRFDGNDFVDCGNAAAMKFTDSFTLSVWVNHETLGGWQNYVGNYLGGVSGYVIAQNGGHLHFHNGGVNPHVLNITSPPMIVGVWLHVVAVYDRAGGQMLIYVDGVRVGSQNADGSVKPSLDQGVRLGSYRSGGECFIGTMDDVKLYNRALSAKEISQQYWTNPHAADRKAKRRMVLEPFFYPQRNEVVAAVNFRRVLPLEEGAKVTAQIARAGADEALDSRTLDPDAPGHEDEAVFSLKDYTPDDYELRAVLDYRAGGLTIEQTKFSYPFAPPAPVADPGTKTVDALSAAVAPPPPYKVHVQGGGGFTVTVKGRKYRIESSYSYPNGGDNRLVVGPRDRQGEKTWRVQVSGPDQKSYRVQARGKHYAIDRHMALEPTRVLIKDTIRNTSDDVVGIILSNGLNIAGMKDAETTLLNGLTAFVHAGDGGVGLLALDDLYQLQQHRRFENGLAELRTEHFGLDKGASYTIEWAIYPTATDNYYDFINQVRRDEGLNGGRVEGTWRGGSLDALPTKEDIDLFNVRYLSLGTPWHPVDDPSVSIEGIEYMEHPQENERVRQFFIKAKQLHPDMKVMIHVAHGLYTTNKPKELFGDSLVIKAGGDMIDYGNGDSAYYRRYFSEQRVKEDYRWYIFYPTMTNSFGPTMLRAMQYMVDKMGVTGMWADGFVTGYAQVGSNTGGYSYDRWDGHSVDIDPKTKLVTRKKTNVSWASLPVLVESVRIVERGGGITLTNSGHNAGSRALWRENIISSCEGSREAVIALHLGRAAASLSSPAPTARATYRDILAKLDLGSLYFWYRHSMDHKTLVEHMYPITIQSIYPGTLRGKERIITKESGVYGWPGDRSLHIVYLYDARGYLAPSNFVSTADDAGVRTKLEFTKDQSAAVVRIPVTLQTTAPVNVNVRRYDAQSFHMVLNGRGDVRVAVSTGEFAIKPGATYRIETDKVKRITAGDDGVLIVPLTFDGLELVTIEQIRTDQ